MTGLGSMFDIMARDNIGVCFSVPITRSLFCSYGMLLCCRGNLSGEPLGIHIGIQKEVLQKPLVQGSVRSPENASSAYSLFFCLGENQIAVYEPFINHQDLLSVCCGANPQGEYKNFYDFLFSVMHLQKLENLSVMVPFEVVCIMNGIKGSPEISQEGLPPVRPFERLGRSVVLEDGFEADICLANHDFLRKTRSFANFKIFIPIMKNGVFLEPIIVFLTVDFENGYVTFEYSAAPELYPEIFTLPRTILARR